MTSVKADIHIIFTRTNGIQGGRVAITPHTLFLNGCLFRWTIHAVTLATPNVGVDILFERHALVYPTGPPNREQSLLVEEDPEKAHSSVTVTIVTYGEKTAHVQLP